MKRQCRVENAGGNTNGLTRRDIYIAVYVDNGDVVNIFSRYEKGL